jgi:hypothetical protein
MQPLDVATVARRSVPVLCIDTCSLLDIMRDPTRDKPSPNERQAAVDLVSELENGNLVCLVAELVATEFGEHDIRIQQEALKAIKKLNAQVAQANESHGIFRPPRAINLIHLEDQVVPARAIVGRWLGAACTALSSAEILAKATGRVIRNVAPAAKGKESTKDCVIFETYLAAVGALRDHQMTSNAVFLSSNVNEYLDMRRTVKSDIQQDLDRLLLTYAPNMAAAKYQLGF